jgi:hypothetical protein
MKKKIVKTGNRSCKVVEEEIAGPAPQVITVKSVSAAVELLQDGIESLAHEVMELQDKLRPVLKPVPHKDASFTYASGGESELVNKSASLLELLEGCLIIVSDLNRFVEV